MCETINIWFPLTHHTLPKKMNTIHCQQWTSSHKTHKRGVCVHLRWGMGGRSCPLCPMGDQKHQKKFFFLSSFTFFFFVLYKDLFPVLQWGPHLQNSPSWCCEPCVYWLARQETLFGASSDGAEPLLDLRGPVSERRLEKRTNLCFGSVNNHHHCGVCDV